MTVPVRCPVCGYDSGDFTKPTDRPSTCPKCGEVLGRVEAKPIDVEARTLAAGVSLTTVAALTLLMAIGWLVTNFVFGPPMPQPVPGQNPGVAAATRFGMRIGQIVPPGIGIVIGLLGIVGGIQLVRQRTWAMSVAGAFAVALPCTCGFPLGLPVGVWALFVLAHPQVREAFERNRLNRAPPGRPKSAA